MDKIIKNKKIIAMALAFVVLLNVIASGVKQYETYSFKHWVYNNYGGGATKPIVSMDNPGIIFVIVAIVLSLVVWGIFVGLAIKYSFAKSTKVQNRKWPYIVMLVFSAITAVLVLWAVFKSDHRVIVLADSVPADAQAAINGKFDNSYGIIYIMSVIGLILDIAIAGLAITALVFIGKAKTAKDLQMTDQVIQTGVEENKVEVENDLP